MVRECSNDCRGEQMNCERCGHPHTQGDWDDLWQDWYVFFQHRRGYAARKAFDAAHREMRKHGPRPGGPKRAPLWLRAGALGFGGREMLKWVTAIWEWLNGKKTLIASILVGIPMIWEIVAQILSAGGVPEHTVAYWGGIILLIVGWAHKLLKTVGLAKVPEKK